MLRAEQYEKQYEECKKEIDTTKFILKHIENKEKFTITADMVRNRKNAELIQLPTKEKNKEISA